MSLNTIRIFIVIGLIPGLLGIAAIVFGLLIVANGPILTNEKAQALVISHWGGCSKTENADEASREPNCQLNITKTKVDGIWYITALYEGYKDDSVAAIQRESRVDYYENNWWPRDPVITYRCQPGRGHQDFSSELCL